MKKMIRFAFLVFIISISNFIMNSCTEPNLDDNSGQREVTVDKEFDISNPELAYPNSKGKTLIFNNVSNPEIVIEQIENDYILSGDIILSKHQIIQIKNSSLFYDKGTGLANLATRWPNCTVYYTINPDLPNQSRVTDAIAHWKAQTNISFVARSSQSNYIEFVSGAGCSSYLGMIGGRQTINLASGCSTGNTIHEIGHALGFFHEHQRTDRNNQIIINLNNVIAGYENNFKTYAALGMEGYQIDALDFSSIMLYGSYAFTNNSLPTITRLDGSTFVGQRNGLSVGDVNMIKNMYQCYTPVPLKSSNGDRFGRNSALSSCSSQNNTAVYYFKKNSVWGLTIGDVIYTNQSGNRLNGGDRWYKIGQLSYRIGSTGVIFQMDDCGVPF